MATPDILTVRTDKTTPSEKDKLVNSTNDMVFSDFLDETEREQHRDRLKQEIKFQYQQENKPYNQSLLDKIVKSIPDQVFRYGNQKVLKNLQSNPYYVPDLSMLVRWFLNSRDTLYPKYGEFAPNKLENWFKDCFPYIQAYSLNNEWMWENVVLITLLFDLYQIYDINKLNIEKLKQVSDYLREQNKSFSEIEDITPITNIIQG